MRMLSAGLGRVWRYLLVLWRKLRVEMDNELRRDEQTY